MKRISCIKLLTLVILFLVSFSSCKKDEIPTTGKLNLSFYNHSLTIKVNVRPVENMDVVIYTIPIASNGKSEQELNAGNYYLAVSAYDENYNYTFYSSKAFQIRVGQTTTINWGSNNDIAE